MKRIFKSILISVAALFLFAGASFAATSVRLQTPTNPTNQDTFNLTFVALDTDSSQTVTVNCYKKAPGDSTYSVFQSFSLTNGGNTDSCQVTSGIMNKGNGTYYFYVTADGTSHAQSQTVSVDFNNETPGTPTNYNKSKPNSCTYQISFHTADDNETTRVVLYRSTDPSFSLDSGHQVNSINIGPNQDGTMTDNISPNCNTTYYYAIRAFDKYGNGSGSVGDSSTSTTIISPTGVQQQQAGAIAGGTAGNVVGGGAGTQGVLGTESAKISPTPSAAGKGGNPLSNAGNWIATHKTISFLILVLILAIAYYLYRRYYKKVK